MSTNPESSQDPSQYQTIQDARNAADGNTWNEMLTNGYAAEQTATHTETVHTEAKQDDNTELSHDSESWSDMLTNGANQNGTQAETASEGYNIADADYFKVKPNVDAKKPETIHQVRFGFLRDQARGELTNRGVAPEDAARIAIATARISKAVRDTAEGIELNNGQIDAVIKARGEFTAAVLGAANKAEDNSVITNAAEVLKGTTGVQNQEAKAKLNAKIGERNQSVTSAEEARRKINEQSGTEPKAEPKKAEAKSTDASQASTTNTDGQYRKTGKELGANARDEFSTVPGYVTADHTGRRPKTATGKGTGIPAGWQKGEDFTAGVTKGMEVEPYSGTNALEATGLEASQTSTDLVRATGDALVDPSAPDRPMLQASYDRNGGNVLDAPKSLDQQLTESIESDENIKGLIASLELARKGYAEALVKREGVTIGGKYKNEIDATAGRYNEIRTKAGGLVALKMKELGFSAEQITEYAFAAATLEQLDIEKAKLAAYQNSVTNSRMSKFCKKWADYSLNATADTRLGRARQHLMHAGTYKKLGMMLPVGIASAATGVVVGAVAAPVVGAAGIGIAAAGGGAAAANFARSFSRNVLTNRIRRGAAVFKKTDSATDVSQPSTSADIELYQAPTTDLATRSAVPDLYTPNALPAAQDGAAVVAPNALTAEDIQTQAIVDSFNNKTNAEVRANRRRAAIAGIAGMAVGAAASELVNQTNIVNTVGRRVHGAYDRARAGINGNGANRAGVVGGAANQNAAPIRIADAEDVIRGPIRTGANMQPSAAEIISNRFREIMNNPASQGMDTAKLQNVANQLAGGAQEIRIQAVPGAGMIDQLKNGLGLNDGQAQSALQELLNKGYINADGSGGIAGVKGTSLENLVNYSGGSDGSGNYVIPRAAIEDLMRRFTETN